MPLTRFVLDQAVHLPGSGSFVSDAELASTSGFIIGEIEDTIHLIPARGDETDSKPRVLYDIPVNEYVKTTDTSTWWSFRQPFGIAASGITLYTVYVIAESGSPTDEIHFELSVKPLAVGGVGQNISTGPTQSVVKSASAHVTPYVVQAVEETVHISPESPFFSFKFTRRGSTDSFDKSVFVIEHGVRFEVHHG